MKFHSQHRAVSGRRPRWRSFSIFALGLGAALAGSVQAAPALSDHAKAQIEDILKVKATFSPAEKKMDSRLVFAARKARGENIGTAAVPLVTAAAADSVTVDIRTVGKVGKPLRKSVVALGGAVQSFQKGKGSVHASVPLTSLTALAADPAVASIRRPSHLMTNVGRLNSQGFQVMKARNVINGLGVTGTNVKVGVMSDSASQAQVDALKATGDLNANASVLVPYDDGKGGDAATDEGAAMMEIVQDMAPDATLLFATAYSTPTEFANNIIALQQAGCSVIVDDVGYSGEGPFQDDVIARAINQVTAAGVLYFSSSANSGNLLNGTSGTWEGDFVDSGFTDFITYDDSATVSVRKDFTYAQIGGNPYDVLTFAGEPYVDFTWSDPLGGSTNDYDFFMTDDTGANIVGFSVTVQDGTQDAVEEIDFFDAQGNATGPAAGDGIFVTATTMVTRTDSSTTPATVTTTTPVTAPRYLRIDTNRGELDVATNGSTSGHNASAATFSTAATFWNSARRGAKANRAQDAHPTEVFSSDGPRHMFFTPDGTPYTPGNFLSTGGIILQKPDAAAVDGVSVETPGFNPFFGTSAAAPHAAGVAALVKSYNPALTNRQIRNLLTNNAIDSEGAGFDVTSGYGVIDALATVLAAPAPAVP